MKNAIILISSIIIALSAFFISLIEFREEYILISVFFMVILCLPTYYFFVKKTEIKLSIMTILALSAFSMIIETIGVLTGFPYGFFSYTDSLGQKIGVIPWTVSFGWVPLVIASWALSKSFLKKQKLLLLKQIILGSLILMIFDLVLDPGSVALNFWKWIPEGIYYGVPLSNYFGWIFSGLIGMTIISLIMKDHKQHKYFLITAYLGNIFWTVVVTINLMIIPAIIGIIITAFLSNKIFFEKNYDSGEKI